MEFTLLDGSLAKKIKMEVVIGHEAVFPQTDFLHSKVMTTLWSRPENEQPENTYKCGYLQIAFTFNLQVWNGFKNPEQDNEQMEGIQIRWKLKDGIPCLLNTFGT